MKKKNIFRGQGGHWWARYTEVKEVRAFPESGFWGPLPQQLWGRWQKPTWVGMIWSLSEEEGRQTEGCGGWWGPRRCCFIHADIWREEGCVSPDVKSRNR